MESYDKLVASITQQIRRSRKEVTILFTDIEDSTSYWDIYGDVKGRLMVNIHNRLAFPVINHFNGRIIKTIGDSIMASFKRPDDALKAAIAIQQVLSKQRKQHADFQLKVRIGIHTGKAIVEDGDVFGNVVNIAARVEEQGNGNDILLSGSTVSKLQTREFELRKLGTFEPKGTRKEIALYRCAWSKLKDLSKEIRYQGWLPLVQRQKREILIYLSAFIAVLYFMYLNYLRYFIADSEDAALISLNPKLLFTEQPFILILAIGLLGWAGHFLYRSRSIPGFLLHGIKGGFGFAVAFMVIYIPVHFLNVDWEENWNVVLHESQHLFVQVQLDDSPVYKEPDIESDILLMTDRDDLLLLADVEEHDGYAWNRVLIAPHEYGWIERIIPRNRRITLTDKFYFRYKDLYPLFLGLLGFLWGVLDFRVKPA